MPPARLRVPGTAPIVAHMAGVVSRSRTVLMRNIVVPYMTMRSPGFWASTLTASDHASMVPVMTGTPAGMPATSRVVTPAASPGQRNGGSSNSGLTCRAHGSYQTPSIVSNSGVHWLAE